MPDKSLPGFVARSSLAIYCLQKIILRICDRCSSWICPLLSNKQYLPHPIRRSAFSSIGSYFLYELCLS